MRFTLLVFLLMPLLCHAKLMVVFSKGDAQLVFDGEQRPLVRGMLVASNSLIKANNGMVQLRRPDGSLLAVKRFQEYWVSHSDVTAAEVGDGLIKASSPSNSGLKNLLRQVTTQDRRASRTTVPEVLLAQGDVAELDAVSAVTAGIVDSDGANDDEKNAFGINRYAGASSGRIVPFGPFTLVEAPPVSSVGVDDFAGASHIEGVIGLGHISDNSGREVYPADFGAGGLPTAVTSTSTEITWGRWTEGVMLVTHETGGYESSFSKAPLHAVVSAALDESLPATLEGVVTFELIGSTAPTDQLAQEGVLGNAELTVDFVEAQVEAAVELALDSHSWAAGGSAPLTQEQLFSGDFDEVVRDGVAGYDGEFHGFVQDKGQVIGGATHSGAAFAYQLEGEQTTVSGVAVFKEP